MSDKNLGIYKKYDVTKISNPTKKMDCIVLEFDDPIARVALRKWAEEMIANGYLKCGEETIEKLDKIEQTIENSKNK